MTAAGARLNQARDPEDGAHAELGRVSEALPAGGLRDTLCLAAVVFA